MPLVANPGTRICLFFGTVGSRQIVVTKVDMRIKTQQAAWAKQAGQNIQ